MGKHFSEYPFNFICPNCKKSLHVSIQEKCDIIDAKREWGNYVNVKCQICGYGHLFHIHWTPYLVSDDSDTLDFDEKADFSYENMRRQNVE